MKNTRCILVASLLLLLAVGIAIPLQVVRGASPDYSVWNDLGIVYTPSSGSAYYPSVLYDVGGFGGGSPLYKMWYSDGSGGVFVVSSTDGLTWGSPVLANGGLSGSPNHVQVLYDSNCFGAASCGTTAAKYRIWYEDMANLYSISALATGSSTDGVNWTASVSGPVAQSGSSPLVTATGWSLGTYGPIHLSYQASATNTGTDPWNYSYVMFFDGTTGAVEATGLAYSVDGLTWTAASNSPVLDIGGGGSWDANYATFGTVLKTGALWSYWYSGGVLTSHEGIGYASSSDGKSWSKAASNPIFSVSQGVSHRNQRVYTPSVLEDGNGNLRMYYSAVGTDGIKKIGLAVLAPGTPGTSNPGTGSGSIGIPKTGFDPMWIPGTGFAPLKITQLKSQPADKAYSSSETQLEIPALNLSVAIVGVPRVQNNWDVTWLGNRAGYLEGTAFPTLPGNSAIAGHIYNSDGKPGPFVGLNLLRYGNEIYILTWGKKYIYEVKENRLVTPDDQSVFKHEEYSWITLLTCQDYDQASNTYRWRRAVRAVLIQIAPSP